MNSSDSRIVKGINVATAIFAGLGILCALLGFLLCGVAMSAVNDPALMNDVVAELEYSSSAFDEGGAVIEGGPLTVDEASAAASVGMTVLMVLLGLYLVTKLVGLIASIMAIRNCAKPEKLGGAFGMAIASAVLAFLFGGFISGILFVVSAVYISRIRKGGQLINEAPYGYAQPGYGQQPQQYGQPQPQQPYYPQQGAAQPQAPAQPAAPVAPVPPAPQSPAVSAAPAQPQAPAPVQPVAPEPVAPEVQSAPAAGEGESNASSDK